MQNIFLFILSLSFFSCKGQQKKLKNSVNFIGIGILTVSIDKPLEIFADENDVTCYDKITFSKIQFGEQKGSMEISTSILKEKLQPYSMYSGSSEQEGRSLINSGLGPESACLRFTVIKSTNDYFEVLLNQTSGEIGYLNKNIRTVFNSNDDYLTNIQHQQNIYPNNYFIFETWDKYFQRAEYVSASNYDLYEKPNGKIILHNNASGNFRVQALDGNWAKVSLNKEKAGWILWHDKKRIIIDIIEYTME